jgi:hypothetical protein
MGLEHVAAVWERSRQSGSNLVVLLAVASYSDHKGEWTIDQKTLQERARLGRRRVQQILADLVAAGELAVVPGDGRGHVSSYRVILGAQNPETAKPSAPLPKRKGATHCQEPEAGCALSPEKGAAQCRKEEAECALSAPLSPPFPPHPPIPLNPPKAQETFGLRPLTGPQSAVFRVNLLLEEAGIPLPSPAQIALWSKTLGSVEPLLELLSRLIHSGLANKREPIPYIHRVVQERAARPEAPARPVDPMKLLRTAGCDEIRRQQAARIAGKRGDS